MERNEKQKWIWHFQYQFLFCFWYDNRHFGLVSMKTVRFIKFKYFLPKTIALENPYLLAMTSNRLRSIINLVWPEQFITINFILTKISLLIHDRNILTFKTRISSKKCAYRLIVVAGIFFVIVILCVFEQVLNTPDKQSLKKCFLNSNRDWEHCIIYRLFDQYQSIWKKVYII